VPRGVISHRERDCAARSKSNLKRLRIRPELAKSFTVYALDYPGHGWSNIPATDYTATLFVDIVGKFLEDQKIENATLIDEGFGYVSRRLRALLELAENAQETHALFNNCYRDYGQRNAIDFQRLV
jgi:pimeloyl-ACP methyl ester carboxylesterase